jgi:putative endopeptidase
MSKRKPTALLLSIGLSIVLTACSSSAEVSTGESAKQLLLAAYEQTWVDSDLQGVITEDKDISLKDDFAAAINRDWKLEIGDKYHDIFQEATDTVLEKQKAAVLDESIQGEEAQVLRKYYALSSDWDYRNSQGIEPLRPYIKDIESISSMDELVDFFCNLQRNPLALAPIGISVLDYYHTEKYPDVNLTLIGAPELSLTDSYGSTLYNQLNSISGLELYESVENRAHYMLQQLGYSKKEAGELIRKCLLWEKKVDELNSDYEIDDIEKNAMMRDEVEEIAGEFPLNAILDSWGFGQTEQIVMSIGYARKLSSLCSKRNLDDIKAFLIVNYCLKSADFLDRETYEYMSSISAELPENEMNYGMSDEQAEDTLQFDYYIGSTAMLGAMNKVYVENYFDDSTISELTKITQDLIDGYKVIFSEEPWLSEEGKAACLEKLSYMKIHIAYQNFEVLDYSKTPFKSKEEGGSFLEAYYAASRYSIYHKTLRSTMKFDRDFWDPLEAMLSTTESNAFYAGYLNGIFICAGVCEPNCYSPDMTYEEKLAGISTIVGHEITHGFDAQGAQYDKEGMRFDWLPYEDQQSFNDKTEEVASYYSTLIPYPGASDYNGMNLNKEATADMGGLKAALYLASLVPDFDYDLFFRSFAKVWRCNIPLEAEQGRFHYDEHPLSFYRVNVGVQQFDEFYDTYGIKEGDGMYLAPEKRIKVW